MNSVELKILCLYILPLYIHVFTKTVYIQISRHLYLSSLSNSRCYVPLFIPICLHEANVAAPFPVIKMELHRGSILIARL